MKMKSFLPTQLCVLFIALGISYPSFAKDNLALPPTDHRMGEFVEGGAGVKSSTRCAHIADEIDRAARRIRNERDGLRRPTHVGWAAAARWKSAAAWDMP